MSIIKVTIHDSGEHWHKRISLFGMPVYHRHDFMKNAEKRRIGFNVYPSDAPTEVCEDEEDFETWIEMPECERKKRSYE